ncbi:MAG: ImmA/IrrE family metallo-endopeptidase [Pseudoclavibacter sp.]|nr:ImmA/IrrE family metallo-endopeptidase [Pseudoclavibacter sp.]
MRGQDVEERTGALVDGRETKPAKLSSAAVAEYAERVGKHHGIYDDRGRADIEALLERLGGRVEASPSMVAHEALVVEERGRFRVVLPPATSARRDRFTIAHELGHYFLHYLLPKKSGPERFRRGARNRAETQANIFAASLLMPSGPFREAVERHDGDWHAVAAVFDVSPRAAEVRAEVLGIGVAS